MASLNKVMLIGHLGRDPEVTYTPGGMAIAKFFVATTDARVDKESGERQERTEWHRVTVFNKLAENCGRFIGKGSQVYVEGRLQTSSYEKDGITRYATEILANTVSFLSRREATDEGGQSQGGGQNPGRGGQPQNGGRAPNQHGGQGGGANQGGGQPKPQPYGEYHGADPGFHNPPDDGIPF